MSAAIKTELTALVQNSVEEFFAATDGFSAYKFAQIGTESPASLVTYASVIGYSGDFMKGSLVITCDKRLLHKSHPNHAMGMPVGDQDILDWVGEMANQLLGRVKNKLATCGVKCTMGTPTTVTGQSMQVTPPKDGFAIPLVYTGDANDFLVYFLFVADQSLELKAVAATNATATEGDSFLF